MTALTDIDGKPLAIGDRVLRLADEQEWIVFALHPDEEMKVYLTREPIRGEETRRCLMASDSGKGFRKL